MGLDMYLSAKDVFFGSEAFGETRMNTYKKVVEAVSGEKIIGGNNLSGIVEVGLSVAYWRKANQVHQWFVDNCGEGVDDCRPYYVTREKLEELLNTCKEVKAGGEKVAEELLSPQIGFFFGGYEIDEYYWEDIDNTIKQLERILKEVPEDWSFEYQASW